MRGDYLLPALAEHPWAMLEGYVDVLKDVAARHVLNVKLSPEDIQARTGKKPVAEDDDPQFALTQDGIAILPLHGVISQRMNLFSAISGGTSTEQFGATFSGLMADKRVRAVLLDVNSPGGSVYGLDELHATMMQARGQKPVWAHVSPLAASAAYWIASAADKIAVDPGGDVGSLGVFAVHSEHSEQDAKEGVKTTIIRSRKFKAEGNEFEPLSTEAQKAMQARVDDADGRFYAAVAAGRRQDKATVDAKYGQGRLVSANDALKSGMVDQITTRRQTLAALAATLGTPQITQSATNTAQDRASDTAQDSARASVWLARRKYELASL